MPIKDDSDLLETLKMSENDAADYLGKKRQTLNTALSNNKKKNERVYFKTGELHTLISAAMTMGHEFSLKQAYDYIIETREPSVGRAFALKSLRASNEIDLSNAISLDLILPGYNAFCEIKPLANEKFQQHVESFKDIIGCADINTCPVRFITGTLLDARLIEGDYGLTTGACKSSSAMEHYIPLILVKNENSNASIVYMVTEQGFFVEAPHYKAKLLSMCVGSLFSGTATKSVLEVNEM